MSPPATATERFADFSASFELDAVPPQVRDAAALHMLDALGCALAAVGVGAGAYAKALAEGSGPATAIGVPAPLPAETAALVNGIRCHALDFDDTHPGSIAHVSAVVVPAAMAAAQSSVAGGPQLLGALIVGNEVTCRVGRVAGDAFHLRGFHPTAICGAFGATAATALLAGLDREQTVCAFGLVGSMAAGLMAYLSDGSETKQIHPGWMAHAAHAAVRLAAAGATGPAAVLEGPNGVYEAFVGRSEVPAEEVAAGLGIEWETPRIAFKPYAGCHFLHAPLDAFFELRAERRFDPSEVVGITVFSPAAGIGLIAAPLERKRRPATPYEGKFSAPFALAAALVLERVDPDVFGEPHLADPALLAVADLVDYEERRYASFPESLPGGVRIELTGGETLERHLDHQRGGIHNPLGEAAVVEKYRLNAAGALPDEGIAGVEQTVLGLASLDSLAALTALASAGGEAA
jgi:2-methylcitrate dehydratase PrpD